MKSKLRRSTSRLASWVAPGSVPGSLWSMSGRATAPQGKWAYDWYKAGFVRLLAGASMSPAEDAPAAKGPAGPISLDAAWRTFQAEVPEGASQVLMTIPKKPGAPVLMRYLAPGAPSDYAYSALTVGGTTGR